MNALSNFRLLLLPAELISLILNELEIKDKLKCRQVCKQFLNLLDQKGKSLVIAKNRLYTNFKWFDDHKLVDFKNLILYRKKFIQSNLFTNRYFIKLKKLHFHYDGYGLDKSVKLNNLNFLNNFKQLETMALVLINVNFFIVLESLLNLKSVHFDLDHKSSLICFSPKLEFLMGNNFDNLHFKYVEQLKHLQTNKDTIHNFESLKKFTSYLQYLKVTLNGANNIDLLIDLINEMKKLKEICIKNHSKKQLDLSKLKICTEKRLIKVFVNGILIDHFDKISSNKDCYLLDEDKLQVYLANYQSIHQNLYFITTINYNSFESFSNCIPNDFQTRLVNLIRIIVNCNVTKKDYFIKFLIYCERIQKLELVQSSLEPNFYLNLNYYLPFLYHLIIQDNEKIIDQIDFNFLFKLKHLSTFKINYHLDLNLVQELFIQKKVFIQIEFLFDDESIIIKPWYKSTFFKETDNENLRTFVDNLTEQYLQFDDDLEPVRFMAGNYLNNQN